MHVDNTSAASSSTNQKIGSASMHSDQVIRENSSRTCTSTVWSPIIFGTLDQYGNPGTSGRQKVAAGGASDQRNISSVKDRLLEPMQVVRQYRPRNLGGSKIQSVAPGTKPGPRWCPMGLTHTHKRRIQQLRALEIKEEIAEKKRDELFN